MTDQSYQLLGDWGVPVNDENKSNAIDCVKVHLLYHLMDQVTCCADNSGLCLAAI